MKQILGIFLTVFAVSWVANAEYYEQDSSFVYKVSPYTELWAKNDGVKMTAKLAHVALVNVLESMQKSGMLPEKVMSRDDLEKLRKSQKDIDHLVEYLNEFVAEQRARGGSLEKVDVLPDAFMIFGGKKVSVAVGKGVSGSLAVGLVMMPVWVEKFDKRTSQKVSEGMSLRTSVVGWPAGDVGLGIGGGVAMRLGVGAIWDLNHAFVNPDQFWGAGVGVSWTPAIFGAGVNVKVGLLSNWELPGWVDFTYATAAIEFGPMAQISTPRVNFSTIVSGPAFMGLFEKSQQDAFKESLKDLNRKMDQYVRDNSGTVPGPNTGRGNGNGDGDIEKPIRPR